MCHHLYALQLTAAIKQEIMLRGPVLTTNFKPSRKKLYHAIIMGWKIKSGVGEAWTICVVDDSAGLLTVHVPVGTCGVDDKVKVPKDDLQQMEWQMDAPYHYRDFPCDSDWTTWAGISCNTTSKRYNKLLTDLKADSILKLLHSQPEIEIAETSMPANSRRARITDFKKSDDKKRPVRVKATFVEGLISTVRPAFKNVSDTWYHFCTISHRKQSTALILHLILRQRCKNALLQQ